MFKKIFFTLCIFQYNKNLLFKSYSVLFVVKFMSPGARVWRSPGRPSVRPPGVWRSPGVKIQGQFQDFRVLWQPCSVYVPVIGNLSFSESVTQVFFRSFSQKTSVSHFMVKELFFKFSFHKIPWLFHDIQIFHKIPDFFIKFQTFHKIPWLFHDLQIFHKIPDFFIKFQTFSWNSLTFPDLWPPCYCGHWLALRPQRITQKCQSHYRVLYHMYCWIINSGTYNHILSITQDNILWTLWCTGY